MAYERATTSQREVLNKVGDLRMSQQELAKIQQVISDTGALSALETKIASLVEQSVKAIAQSSLNETAIKQLTELAEFIAARKN